MTYSKQTWVNGASGSTPISAARLQHMEDGIEAAAAALGNVDNTSDANKPVSTAQLIALNAKAPLASPVFTGSPTAPTPTVGDNDTSIATTAFVTAAVAAVSTPTQSSYTMLPASGTLVAGTNVMPPGLMLSTGNTLTGGLLWVTTAPVGSALTVKLQQSGLTLQTITMSAGASPAYVEFTCSPAVAVTAHALITVDVTSVGSTTAAAGLGLRLDFDSSVSGTTPTTPSALFTSSFVGSNGAAWPSGQWAKSSATPTQTSPSGPAIQGNEGRLTTNTVGSYGAADNTVMIAQGYTEVAAREVAGRFRLSNITDEMYPSVRLRGDATGGTTNGYSIDFITVSSTWQISKKVSSTDTALLSGLSFTYVANTWYRFRFQVNGTVIQAKLWTDGGTEPNWSTASDSALTTAGKTAVALYGGGTVHGSGVDYIEWDSITVTAL